MKFKNLLETTSLAMLLALPAVVGCSDDGSGDTDGDETSTGDGDGDATDTDMSGDGDGDATDTDATDTEATDTDETDTDETDSAGDPMGMLRLVHLGVFPGDTGTDVDIFVNGENAGITFAFKDTTDYVALPVGTYTFDVVPSGGTIDDSVFTVPDFPLAEGDMWEIFAAGYVAPEGEGDAAFSVSAFPENWADIPAGNNRLNIVHTGAWGALNPVDVWLVDDECAPTEPLLENFEYGTYAADVDLPDAALKIGFDVGQDQTVDACFEIPALGGDILVNAFAVNDDAGNVSILAHLPDGTAAELTPLP